MTYKFVIWNFHHPLIFLSQNDFQVESWFVNFVSSWICQGKIKRKTSIWGHRLTSPAERIRPITSCGRARPQVEMRLARESFRGFPCLTMLVINALQLMVLLRPRTLLHSHVCCNSDSWVFSPWIQRRVLGGGRYYHKARETGAPTFWPGSGRGRGSSHRSLRVMPGLRDAFVPSPNRFRKRQFMNWNIQQDSSKLEDSQKKVFLYTHIFAKKLSRFRIWIKFHDSTIILNFPKTSTLWLDERLWMGEVFSLERVQIYNMKSHFEKKRFL